MQGAIPIAWTQGTTASQSNPPLSALLSACPGASKQESSQPSLCALSYAAFLSPKNNPILEKSSKQETKINFPAAFASVSEYKVFDGGCPAMSWQQKGTVQIHILLLCVPEVAHRVQSQNLFTYKTNNTREEYINKTRAFCCSYNMLQLTRQGKQSKRSAWALPLYMGKEETFCLIPAVGRSWTLVIKVVTWPVHRNQDIANILETKAFNECMYRKQN